MERFWQGGEAGHFVQVRRVWTCLGWEKVTVENRRIAPAVADAFLGVALPGQIDDAEMQRLKVLDQVR